MKTLTICAKSVAIGLITFVILMLIFINFTNDNTKKIIGYSILPSVVVSEFCIGLFGKNIKKSYKFISILLISFGLAILGYFQKGDLPHNVNGVIAFFL